MSPGRVRIEPEAAQPVSAAESTACLACGRNTHTWGREPVVRAMEGAELTFSMCPRTPCFCLQFHSIAYDHTAVQLSPTPSYRSSSPSHSEALSQSASPGPGTTILLSVSMKLMSENSRDFLPLRLCLLCVQVCLGTHTFSSLRDILRGSC